MKDVLETALTGGAVLVSIREAQYPLAYPMHAVILYRQQTLDSLFDPESWPRIDLGKDPERWLACLWAGMHQQQADRSWKAPFTLDELGGLVGFDNAAEISIAMVKALTQFMPKATKEEPDSKNVGAPDVERTTMPAKREISPGSGPELVSDCILPATAS